MNALKWIYQRTLNSVVFGILTMAAIGAYIAVGSGMPSVREYFEADEILFFTAWPLKLLMALLVLNLAVVTVTRIPFTPPRYGVWMIHLGIILLVLSTGAYYSRKVEGLALVPVGQTVGSFYDRWDRAIYARVEFRNGEPAPLWGLPRFARYDEATGNASYLTRKSSLRGIEPRVRDLDPSSQQIVNVPLSKAIGFDKPITIDVVGYFPYAQIVPVNRLTISREGFSQAVDVVVGQRLDFDQIGYTVTVENFERNFPMFGTGEPVDVITLLITRDEGEPTTYRRMVLAGKAVQTDFLIGVEGAGPMGKRQEKPVDPTIVFDLQTDVGQRVFEVPPEERNRNAAANGYFQVLEIVLRAGEYERRMYLDYVKFADQFAWPGGPITIPGAERPFELAFGDLRRDMPVWVKLDKFEAIPYAGAPVNENSMMRDFVSHLTVTDKIKREPVQMTARLNSPAFVSRSLAEGPLLGQLTRFESWILFQSQWDPEGQRWTILGVGNRPAVRIMTLSCAMIFIGLFYAFYFKPVLIRRMKQKAIQKAIDEGKLPANAGAKTADADSMPANADATPA